MISKKSRIYDKTVILGVFASLNQNFAFYGQIILHEFQIWRGNENLKSRERESSGRRERAEMRSRARF